MSINGLLTDVRWEWTGTEVTADLAAGTTVLPVLDPEAVTAEENVWIADTGPYEIVSTNVDASTLTVTPGLSIAVDQGTEVATDIGGQPGRAWVGEVILADADKPVEIPLTVHDLAVMPEGTYDPPVAIVVSDDLEHVENLPGSMPVIDGSYIPPSTLPDTGGTDGNPPSISPAPVVVGGIGAFYVRWPPPPNNDPMRFEVHVSPDDNFAPSSTTLYTETSAYSATLRNLPYIDPATGEYAKFLYEKPYYFRIVAKDADGSAAPSVQEADFLVQVNTPDIAVRSVIAENIVTGTLTGDLFAGQVVLGSTISTGTLDADGNITGARVDLGPDGLIIYGADGKPVTAFPLDQKGDAFIRQAHLEIYSADVIDNFVMHGLNNRIDAGAKFTLGKGIEAPGATAQLQQTYDHVQFDVTTVVAPPSGSSWPMGTFSFNPSEARSMAWDTTNNCWRVIQEKGNGFRLWRFNADGTIKQNPFVVTPWVDDFKGFHSASTSANAMLFTNNADWIFWGPTVGGTLPPAWIINTNQDPFLSWDPAAGSGGQHMLCQNTQGSGSRPIQVRRFTQDGAGNPVNASIATSPNGLGIGNRINGMFYGVADLGASRYVNTYETNGHVSVWTAAARMNTNGTYQEWSLETAPQAFAYDGASFWSLAASGIMTKYTGWTWTMEPATTSVGMSGFDSSTAGDQANPWPGQSAGQHETPVGSLAGLQMRRRSKLTITVPVAPAVTGGDNQDKWKVYWSRTATTVPAKTDMHLVATLGDPNVTQTTVMLADSVGGNPPGGIQGQVGSANNFPAGNPALFQSAAIDGLGPMWQLKGDGSGRAGPYKWDSAGKDLVKNGLVASYQSATTNNLANATFVIVPAWVVDTFSTAPEFVASFVAGNFIWAVPGMYLILGRGSIGAGGQANPLRRIAAIQKNGVEQARTDTGAGANANAPSTLGVEVVLRIAAGDTINLMLWQSSGSGVPMVGNPGHTFQAIKLSD